MMTTLLLAAAFISQPVKPAYMIDSEASRHMSMAVFQYAQEHNDQLPPDMASMMDYVTGDLSKATPDERIAAYRNSFFTSQDQGMKIPADATPQWIAEHSSLTYLGLPNVSFNDLPSWNDLAILHVKLDKGAPGEVNPNNPEGRLYTISFIDSHTEVMSRLDAERIIAESTAVYAALSAGKPLPTPHQTVLDLQAISHAIHAYAKVHQDSLPPDLGSTLPYIPTDKRHPTPASRAAVFLSVEAQKSTHIPDDPTPEWVNEHASYIYLGAADAKLAKVEDPTNTILLHGRLDAPIDVAAQGRRGIDVKSFPLLSTAGEGSLQQEKYTRWIIDISKRVIESARSGAPLPDHLNALRDCRLISDALFAYAKAHDNILPPDLGATLAYLKLDENAATRDKAQVYLSPKAERSTGIPDEVTPDWINRYTSYVFLGANTDLKLAREAGIQVILHSPFDEPYDIMERGSQFRAAVMGFPFGEPIFMELESLKATAAESKQSLDAIRAGMGK